MKEGKARKINRPKTRRRNKDGKGKKINEDAPKIQKVGSAEAHGERPLVIAHRSRISHYFGSLAVTYAERISATLEEKKVLVLVPSGSAAISQINNKDENLQKK